MSELKICRICVTTGTKMYRLERFHLRNYYEEITALKIGVGDNLPRYFCYECAMMLLKFHKFKEKCYSGQKVLMEMLWRGPITYENVSKIDRSLRNIQSILQIITESERIKHYNIIYGEEPYIKAEPEEVEVEFVGENSYYYPMAIDNMVMVDTMAVDNTPIDTTAMDATAIDATAIDATVIDVTAIDATAIDATAIDATAIDATAIDATAIDATAIDAMTIDATAIDAMAIDTTVTTAIKTAEQSVKKKVKRVRRKREIIKEITNPYEKEGLYHTTNKANIILSTDKWKKHKLSVEEAVKEYCARAQSSGYLRAKHKCTDCYRGFSEEDMMKRHFQLRHNKSYPYECSFCKMNFKRRGHCKLHMRQHFTKYQCLLCKFICTRENSALLHVESHSGVKRKCPHCGKLFRHSSTYYTHMRTAHRSEYICAICGASFVSETGLHQHKRVKHVTTDVDNPDDKEEKEHAYCDRCDIKFTTKKAYEVHLLHSALHTEQEVQDKVTPKMRKRVRGRESTETDAPKRKRSNVRRERVKPTTCYQCGQHFETQNACMKHHIAEHPGTSFTSPTARHICELCGASLAPASIATHNNMHTRDKLYSCDNCDKTFHNTAARNRHMLTHTGEKPYACSLCDKRFTQSNSVKLHYRTFHLKEPYPKRNRKKNNNKQ